MSSPAANTCYKTSDNKFFQCPPRMADGRHFTDYRPSCHVNDLIKADNSINNSFQYRVFLQENANKLMDLNRQHACEKNCCGPCPVIHRENFDAGTMLPEQYMFVTDGRMAKIVLNDPNGIGTGRRHWTFDSNNTDCAQLPSAYPKMKENKCVSPLDSFNYNADLEKQPELYRYSMISGGELLQTPGTCGGGRAPTD